MGDVTIWARDVREGSNLSRRSNLTTTGTGISYLPQSPHTSHFRWPLALPRCPRDQGEGGANARTTRLAGFQPEYRDKGRIWMWDPVQIKIGRPFQKKNRRSRVERRGGTQQQQHSWGSRGKRRIGAIESPRRGGLLASFIQCVYFVSIVFFSFFFFLFRTGMKGQCRLLGACEDIPDDDILCVNALLMGGAPVVSVRLCAWPGWALGG